MKPNTVEWNITYIKHAAKCWIAFVFILICAELSWIAQKFKLLITPDVISLRLLESRISSISDTWIQNKKSYMPPAPDSILRLYSYIGCVRDAHVARRFDLWKSNPRCFPIPRSPTWFAAVTTLLKQSWLTVASGGLTPRVTRLCRKETFCNLRLHFDKSRLNCTHAHVET